MNNLVLIIVALILLFIILMEYIQVAREKKANYNDCGFINNKMRRRYRINSGGLEIIEREKKIKKRKKRIRKLTKDFKKGFIKGAIVGFISSGPAGALPGGVVYGLANPMISTAEKYV